MLLLCRGRKAPGDRAVSAFLHHPRFLFHLRKDDRRPSVRADIVARNASSCGHKIVTLLFAQALEKFTFAPSRLRASAEGAPPDPLPAG